MREAQQNERTRTTDSQKNKRIRKNKQDSSSLAN